LDSELSFTAFPLLRTFGLWLRRAVPLSFVIALSFVALSFVIRRGYFCSSLMWLRLRALCLVTKNLLGTPAQAVNLQLADQVFR
jgi:hypothetical protein